MEEFPMLDHATAGTVPVTVTGVLKEVLEEPAMQSLCLDDEDDRAAFEEFFLSQFHTEIMMWRTAVKLEHEYHLVDDTASHIDTGILLGVLNTLEAWEGDLKKRVEKLIKRRNFDD